MDQTQEQVRRALIGEAAAVRWLVDHLTPVVQARVARVLLRWARAAGRRCARQEVEDLVQEAFVALFEHDGKVLRSWDPARGMSLANFAGLVAERQAVSILRSGRRSPWTEDPTLPEELDQPGVAPAGLEQQVASREILGQLLDRLRTELSPRGMDLFERLLLRQEPVEEVCAASGLSRDAVYAWRSRLGKLVRRLGTEMLSESAAPPRIPKAGGST